ncbi:porin, partial [Streptococcus pyogenes]
MRKSLMLAALAASTAGIGSAYAADPTVIAEPEPAEFVNICDVYGVGFFYIPGTETCLRLSGYVRYDIGVGKNLGSDVDG